MTVLNEPSTRKRRTSSAAPTTGTAPDGLRAQGVRTRNAIIRVARKLLLENGPMDFSLRAVAVKAGISVSNLQYYFPTRPAVLRAVMAPVIDAYVDALKHALESNTSPHAAIEAILSLGLQDAKDSKNIPLWWHFFSFASTDPECAQMRDDWYDTITSEFSKLIRAVNPEHGAAESAHIAILLISMVDGMTLHLGTTRSKRAYMRGFETMFLATARNLVWGKTVDAETV
ncbi:TPA: TetR/AcrR family transcriptional regulator [Burkholderia aenigmatica]|uniref:TetR/AcrR family transcriptional regulator n=1 Tax=Burkholderia sp. AU45251 TaxID=3059204 RepID=UPI0026559E51|nr:TetR/AcrR family transcriptional regulator [Burkholderia sp. AU45251]HDR9482571.1 TetR/AcrR family transcriptional regulator [Burkholderia aenigmatica]MDN7517731.1 TetR/AcrR family transcriptional regulator [Burkholderia sp. AU45251]HDR9513518.1 TetR/AcrR family transcriptional regulator [Burkholderia aenigmatica]HDR9590909.1 TetR/AcrR family transcriptional regulator [Burkholderia aenigmatica]HDR9601697.1 TetR/AcrR family transcriptional regulator [Burkholderia aenigmatica]